MATTPDDVLKLIKDKEVKFVDLRFTDTRGKEQHVTVPVKYFGKDKFEQGHAFDGSSIAGWKGIQASDMLLMPDPGTAVIDPFMDEITLNITCDVVEPSDGKGYERDPRSLAKRAEAYLKSTGLGDTAYFGPEPEFFIFDAVEWSVDMSGSYCKVFSSEAAWSTADKFEGGNMENNDSGEFYAEQATFIIIRGVDFECAKNHIGGSLINLVGCQPAIIEDCNFVVGTGKTVTRFFIMTNCALGRVNRNRLSGGGTWAQGAVGVISEGSIQCAAEDNILNAAGPGRFINNRGQMHGLTA